MEKGGEYRKKLADDLREAKSLGGNELAEEFLDASKGTEEYKEAREEKISKRKDSQEKEKQAKIDAIKDKIAKMKGEGDHDKSAETGESRTDDFSVKRKEIFTPINQENQESKGSELEKINLAIDSILEGADPEKDKDLFEIRDNFNKFIKNIRNVRQTFKEKSQLSPTLENMKKNQKDVRLFGSHSYEDYVKHDILKGPEHKGSSDGFGTSLCEVSNMSEEHRRKVLKAFGFDPKPIGDYIEEYNKGKLFGKKRLDKKHNVNFESPKMDGVFMKSKRWNNKSYGEDKYTHQQRIFLGQKFIDELFKEEV